MRTTRIAERASLQALAAYIEARWEQRSFDLFPREEKDE